MPLGRKIAEMVARKMAGNIRVTLETTLAQVDWQTAQITPSSAAIVGDVAAELLAPRVLFEEVQQPQQQQQQQQQATQGNVAAQVQRLHRGQTLQPVIDSLGHTEIDRINEQALHEGTLASHAWEDDRQCHRLTAHTKIFGNPPTHRTRQHRC